MSESNKNPYLKYDSTIKENIFKMRGICGARNTVGFSSGVKTGILPPHTHLTYEGLFNELKYNVGPKTDKVVDLHFGYSRFQFINS